MCREKLQSEIKKAIGGEKSTKENVSEKKARGKRSRNALQRNKERRLNSGKNAWREKLQLQEKSDFGNTPLSQSILKT